MSESVRHHLELRVAELEDLFKKSLFSRDEIKEIVAKRTKFEYKIKRRGCLLDDFLAYIRYETELEATRKQRYELLGIKAKHSVSDHAIPKYVLSLYRRAVSKFRGNVELWEQYIAFARESGADRAVSKIFAAALQIHPGAVDIWIGAARWELVRQDNPASARALFLRSLRMNKEAKTLWLEYFRLELEVANALSVASQETTAVDDETKDVVTAHQGAIPISVFKFATQQCKLDASEVFNYHLLSAAFERLSAVTAFIDSFAEKSLPDNYTYYILKAKAAMSGIDFDDESSIGRVALCMRQLNSAFNAAQSPAVITDVVSVLCALFDCAKDKPDLRHLVYDKIAHILATAEQNDLITADHYMTWLRVAKSTGGEDLSAKIVQEALRRFPDHAELQLCRLDVETVEHVTGFASLAASCVSMMQRSTADATDMLNGIFERYADTRDEHLLELARLSARKMIPSSLAIEYLSCQDTIDAVIALADCVSMSAAYAEALLSVIVKRRSFTPSVRKFVNRMVVCAGQVFKQQTTALLLAKFSILVGDIELSSRVYAKSMSSLVPADNFAVQFEQMKETIEIC